MSVETAAEFFVEEPAISRSLQVLLDVGLGYLRLCQAATELSGGEAQRVKLATELQRIQRGQTLYILDEPTTGLHPSDVERLQRQLNQLVEAGNTVIVVEHDMQIVASSDWVIDVGPGAGDEGGRIVAEGPPDVVANAKGSKTLIICTTIWGPIPKFTTPWFQTAPAKDRTTPFSQVSAVGGK